MSVTGMFDLIDLRHDLSGLDKIKLFRHIDSLHQGFMVYNILPLTPGIYQGNYNDVIPSIKVKVNLKNSYICFIPLCDPGYLSLDHISKE